MEETYYKTRLRSCKRIFGIDDPRTVEVMTRLANIYRRQSKYHEREYWLRHIALSMQRTHGFKHRRTLSAYFAVVGSLQFQGKCRQAAKIHQLVHAAILSLIGPEDELTLESSITMSDICNSLREYEEADGISRRILQMRLATLGPRHIDSLRAMRRVASVLNSTGKLLEAEQLLGIVLQLQHDIEDFDEHIAFFNEYELARVLRYQGRYSESKILVSRRAEQSEISFGPEYRETLLCYYQIAMCLAELEQYTESESLLQRTLERQLKRFGISDVGTIETMYSLAKALEKRGHSQEAANYFEKCFTECAENYGLEHFVTIQICDKLGRCYERLGRYEDALSLYQRTVDQLRTTNTDDHPSIVRIRGWIDELRDILAARQEGALNEQGETGVYGVLSNDGGSVEEGSATTSEDWMNDFVDFQTPKEDAGGGSI